MSTRARNAATIIAEATELLESGRPAAALHALGMAPKRLERDLEAAHRAGWDNGQQALVGQIMGDDAGAGEATPPARRRGAKHQLRSVS
jgi:hypothetical protein